MPNPAPEAGRPGPWLVLFGVGILTGTILWALGLGRAFEQGLEAGLQDTELGQVQVASETGGFEQYFRLRALIEGIPGVVAVSARLDFPARVTGARGQVKDVRVRAVGFLQENRVTGFQDRVIHGVSDVMSGLIIPFSWESSSFLFPSTTATLSAADGTWQAQVPVSGSLEKPSVLLGPETVFLDLERAQSLLGPSAAVTSFALRLSPGIDPAAWVQEHADSFAGTGAVVQDWRKASAAFRQRLTSLALPLFVFQGVTVILSLTLLFVLVRRRKPSGVSLLPPRPAGGDIAVVSGVGVAGAVAAFIVFRAVFPAVSPLLTGAALPFYPALAGTPDWAPGWESLALPVTALAAAYQISSWSVRKPRPAKDSPAEPSSPKAGRLLD